MTDSFVAQSTPPGISALALIRASGPDCTGYAQSLLPPNAELRSRHAYFGKLKDRNDELIDEVVWIYYEPGASFTGDAMLEIMPHGNPLICKSIIDDLCKSGFRLAEPGEFTRSAYLNGKLKFSQIQGILEVIHAQSDRALSAARKRLTGASGSRIKGIVQELTKLRAEVEAYIDFPEDELPPEENQGPIKRILHILNTLDALHASSKNRDTIQNGIHTLIIGAPNAGKSSLLNALIGHNRALVSKEAGTTRDYILEHIELNGYLINLFDTAGLNIDPSSELEAQGIQHTVELANQAEFILLVIDSSQTPPVLPEGILKSIDKDNAIVVENKIDLPNSGDHKDYLPHLNHVRLSAIERSSLSALEECWGQMIQSQFQVREEEGLMFDLREQAFVETSIEELNQAKEKLETDSQTELAAFHLIRASEALLQINEHVDNEAILDELFSRFCIGK